MNLHNVCKGNNEAYSFLYNVYQVVQIWDNLHDGDETTVLQRDHAFERLFLDLPLNPFYTQYFSFLHPVVTMCLLNWKLSNDLPEGLEHVRYVLRSMFYELCMAVALLVGGRQHAVTVGQELWTDSVAGESYDDFYRKVHNGLDGK